jgi:hypothetical protein
MLSVLEKLYSLEIFVNRFDNEAQNIVVRYAMITIGHELRREQRERDDRKDVGRQSTFYILGLSR